MDLLIKSQLLYQLSYRGSMAKQRTKAKCSFAAHIGCVILLKRVQRSRELGSALRGIRTNHGRRSRELVSNVVSDFEPTRSEP